MISDIDLNIPFPDVFPDVWNSEIGPRDFAQFRNLNHFKYEVSKLTQIQDDKCGMTYNKALSMLLNGETDFPEKEQELIRDEVRQNLHKRGLITEEIYENFRYTVDGTQVDVDAGKYANGEPDCVMSPSRQYIDFFYELYINISYPHFITDEDIRIRVAKILATIEELERQHIFIKISLVFPARAVCSNRAKSNLFLFMPLYSHKEPKSVATMSSVVNERLLRKFVFAVMEEVYGDDLDCGYGIATTLDGTMNLSDKFDEVEFFEFVQNAVGA